MVMRHRVLVVVAALLLAADVAAQAAPSSTLVDEELMPLMRVAPQYPRHALREGIEGFVDFEVVVNPDGTVKSATPAMASPEGVFETAALLAIKKWLFRPGLVDGKPVETSGRQRIDFRMIEHGPTPCETARGYRPAPITAVWVYKGLEDAMKRVRARDYAAAEKVLGPLLQEVEDPYGRATVLQALAMVLAFEGRTDDAISGYERAQAVAGLPWGSHDYVTLEIVRLHQLSGRNEQALQLLERYFKEACEPTNAAHRLREKLTGARTNQRPVATPTR